MFAQYEGLTVAEALKLKPDVATGATYTSEALIKNIQMGLKQAKAEKPKKSASKKSGSKKRSHWLWSRIDKVRSGMTMRTFLFIVFGYVLFL